MLYVENRCQDDLNFDEERDRNYSFVVGLSVVCSNREAYHRSGVCRWCTMKPTNHKDESQKQRFIKFAKEAEADMSKEEFGRVIGKMVKSEESRKKNKVNSGRKK